MSFFTEHARLRTLSARDRRALVLGAAVLLPALAWGLVVRPYRAYLNELQERTAAERALLLREQSLLRRAATLPAAVAAAEAEAQRAELRLVRAANAPLAEAELTGYLQSVASASRVLLHELRGVEPRRGETLPAEVRPIRLSLAGESDLEGVVTFLERLEASPLLIRVRELVVEPVRANHGDDAAPTGVMRFTFTIEAFAPGETDIEPVASRPQRSERETVS
jgi:hypothetical protein